jgi:hypothetical protein
MKMDSGCYKDGRGESSLLSPAGKLPDRGDDVNWFPDFPESHNNILFLSILLWGLMFCVAFLNLCMAWRLGL